MLTKTKYKKETVSIAKTTFKLRTNVFGISVYKKNSTDALG
jgi:hypothetical protein